MNILTLLPSRNAEVQTFKEGTFAHFVTSRPVFKNGVQILKERLTESITPEGILRAELLPNSVIDNADFHYIVAVYTNDGTVLYIHKFVMPEEDVSIWDVVPEEVDPDSIQPAE